MARLIHLLLTGTLAESVWPVLVVGIVVVVGAVHEVNHE